MTAPVEDIAEIIKNMESDISAIENQLVDICFHMKGGIPWDIAWTLSHADRERIIKSVNDKLQKMNGGKEYM